MYTILKAYGVNVDRVLITLKDEIFYGTLTLSVDGQTKQFDSRSSDAIALAIHFKTPIVVGKGLLDSAGQPLEDMAEKVEL
jgi:bifunctional DNase/RNase